MIIDWSGAFELLRQYRIAWLSGRFGAGKTAMAVAMAEYLASKYGYRVYSNFPLVFDEFDTGVKGEKVLHAVFILDEAGLEIVARVNTLAERMIAYTRKMDIVILLPSFIPPSARIRFLQYYPIINLASAGVPLAIYGWRVNLANFKASGSFLVANPNDYYRMYNSFVAQDTDLTGRIYESIIEKVTKFSNSKLPEPDKLSEADKLFEVMASMEELLSQGFQGDGKRTRK